MKMAEIKNYKIEVLIFSLPLAPVWITVRILRGACPLSVQFQRAGLRVSQPAAGLSGLSAWPPQASRTGKGHLRGQWFAVSETCDWEWNGW